MIESRGAPPAIDGGGLPGPAVAWRRQLLLLASVALVAAFALRIDGRIEPAWVEPSRYPPDARAWLAGALAVGVALFAARRTMGVGRLLGWGAAIVLASLGPHAGPRDVRALQDLAGLHAIGAIGALACGAAASLAIARMPAAGGMVRPATRWPVAAVVAMGALAGVSIAALLAPPGGARGLAWLTAHPRAWSAAASAASALVILGQIEWTVRARRLELGVDERAAALRTRLGASSAVALAIGACGLAQVDALGRAFLAVASALVASAALDPDAERVARATRRAVGLVLAGGGAAVVGSWIAARGGDDARWATIVTASAALAVGAGVAALESRLRPSHGAWLDACARACVEASRPEPDDAIREVLVALRARDARGGLSSPSPELWTLAPARATKVDTAGYLQDRDEALPDRLLATAQREPEKTLRADVLDALEVRRPDLRPLARWLSDRGACLATVVSGGADAEGILLLIRPPGAAPPTLDEVRAFKRVADRLAAPCQARATRARLLAWAHEADRRAEEADERAGRLQHERALYEGRDALAAARLARPATVGVYAAGSRMALEALARHTALGAPIAVVAPSGVDPVPHLARAHLAGPRRDAPLVLVDATSAREHDLARWSDPLASPLALADRGMLVLLDGAALPANVQQLVARALAERRAPWDRPEPLDVQIALTSVVAPEDLAAHARLDPSLAVRFGDACASPVVLPRLRDRVEDLRAIITDRLAREGLRVFGRPVGIEHAAYAHLVEYPFPGEEAELAVIVQSLVASCAGDLVRVADIAALLERGVFRPDRRAGGVGSLRRT
jgi:hypothetical protein